MFAAPGGGADEGEVLDLLSGVVDKSLVGVESEGVEVRYRLLEIVREYANEKLAEAGEGDAARRHHRDFFLTLASTQEDPAERTRNWSTGSWIRLADTDHHNFGAALDGRSLKATTRPPSGWRRLCGGTGGGHGPSRVATGWSGLCPVRSGG